MTAIACPSCGAVIGPPVPAACPSCGLPVGTALGRRLLVVERRLAELGGERRDLLARMRAAAATNAATAIVAQPPSAQIRRVVDPVTRWLRTAGPPTLLAAAGVVLLAIAAVVFTAVAWRDLPVPARGGLLAVAAAGCGLATHRLAARGLERTAEATAVLTIALLGVLINGLWRGGLLDRIADGGAMFTAACGGLAAVSHALARVTSTRSPRVLAAWLAPAAMVAFGLRMTEELFALRVPALEELVVSAAALAAALLAGWYARRFLDDLPVWRVASQLVAACLWSVAVTGGVVVLANLAPLLPAERPSFAGAAVLVAATVGAAALLRRPTAGDAGWWDPVGVAGMWLAGTAGGAAAIHASSAWAGTRVLVPAVVGAAALWLLGTPRSRAAAAVGMAPVAAMAVTPLAALAAWVAEAAVDRIAAPWPATGASLPEAAPEPATVVLALGVVAVAVVLAAALRRRSAAAVAGLAGLAVVAVAVGLGAWPAGGGVVAAVLASAVAAAIQRRTSRPLGAVVMLAGAVLTAAALGLSSEAATIAALAACAAVAAWALEARDRAALGPTAALLAADVSALAAAGTAAVTAEPGPVGVAVTVAAGLGWLAAATVRRRTAVAPWVEVTACVAFACGITVTAFAAAPWLATGFAVLAVAAAGVSAWRDDRRWMRWVATGAATASSWTVLADLDIEVVEAYTAPPALVIITLAAAALRARSDESSWHALAVGIALLITPPVAQLVADPDDLPRLAASVAVGVALVSSGRRWGLQAPLVFGAGALIVCALTQHDVVTDVLPRWLLLAAAGTVLLWLSMSYERQLQRLRGVREGLARLR